VKRLAVRRWTNIDTTRLIGLAIIILAFVFAFVVEDHEARREELQKLREEVERLRGPGAGLIRQHWWIPR
jgi:hypothetical protein